METHSFRQATKEDQEQVQAIVFSALFEYGLKPEPKGTDMDLFDLEAHYFKAGGDFLVVENVHGVVVGCFGLFRVSEESCELRKMYLLKSARGQGLGKKMLEQALKRAKELGFRRVELETASQLKEAISLYQKFGFRPCPRTHAVPRCDQAFELLLI